MISNFLTSHKTESKCYVTRGILPRYVDRKQLPSRKKPFVTILNQTFTHTVEIILSEGLFNFIWTKLENRLGELQYSRMIMTLASMLEGDFFNFYIKSGNILMISEGRPGIDNLYTLTEGVLRLELSKEHYERTGLSGKPIRTAGRKHIKARYDTDVEVEVDLRLPSMLHGKKGFERVVWAFKNVLNHAVTWLFHDFNACPEATNSQPSIKPISGNYPDALACAASTGVIRSVLMPNLDNPPADCTTLEFSEWATSVNEWIGLVTLESPRVLLNDTIDPYLCRYAVLDNEQKASCDLVRVRWIGLIPAPWIRCLFIDICDLMAASHDAKSQNWFSLSAYAFGVESYHGKVGYSILKTSSERKVWNNDHGVDGSEEQKSEDDMVQQYILWEFSQLSDI